MKLKAIFIKSDEAKRRKHQIRKERKKQNMLTTHMGSRLMNLGSQKPQGNPFANVFNDLM